MASGQKLRFNAEHIKLIRDQFKLVDSDGDRLINEDEFRKLFRSFGQTVSNKRLDSIVSEVFKDLDGSKGIDFETFINSFIKFYSRPPTEKALAEALSLFENSSGYLDKPRLFNLLSTRGEKLSKSELEEFSQIMGLNKDVSKLDSRKLAENMCGLLSQVPTPN
ncbi:uncharacterized protein TA10070 [Theileria annulata]|uniref:EF-hand domain-containing protein n=1 Tax=Theileria annulata TaxID=5874 RepID=Q4U8S4_THEAN|nr:uncharacterized protein TA10070 [Theileria annulata]CAI76779.1 hypothetical protein, conserved [Theileria annulata]|eukprot:XP_953404.1 hypothetical protein, conserved [Theileria annulata]